jgi:glycosyltransferase involved in cell wall biosynthesis
MSSSSLRILYVATKPAFPPNDGGRLLMWNTIVQLAARGHRITFVAPDLDLDNRESEEHLSRHCAGVHLVPARAGLLAPSLIGAVLTAQPLSIIRHSHRAVRTFVADALVRETYDVIHAEQIHSLANLPRSGPLPPVVLRVQNVESQLWRMVARIKPRLAWLARREARYMAAHEASAVARTTTTVALTDHDGCILGGALGMAARRIRIIPPPFPSPLSKTEEPLEGDPAIVLVAGGWLPNRDSTRWFFASIWDEIRRLTPAARVHVFGSNVPQAAHAVSRQHVPTDSITLFRRAAILVVPLRVASGIRMKILEAWARGVPVVATPEAVCGLDGTDGKEYLLARDGPEFAAAIQRLHGDPNLRQRLIDSGRSALAARYEPNLVASMLEAAYLEAAKRDMPVS